MDLIPDDLMSEILARVPLGKPKIKMQGVSRRWQRLLHGPAAHSLKTCDEDGYLPVDPTATQDEGAGSSGVSRRLLSALCCCRLKTDYVKGKPVPPSGSLAWLPQRLERLKIETTIVLDWGTCPVLPRLRNLDMQKLLSPPPPLLSPHFPSLEVVSVKTERAWVGPDFDVAALFEDLEGLPNIREVNVAMSGELLDFNGPPGCRVNMKFSLNYFPQFDEGQVNLPAVPAGLASHLKSMQIRFGFFESEGNTKLDLGNFGECGVLSRLCLELIEGEAIFGDLLVHGLDILPASCRSVVLRKAQDGLPFVLPAPGWQIFPGLSDIEVELRRV